VRGGSGGRICEAVVGLLSLKLPKILKGCESWQGGRAADGDLQIGGRKWAIQLEIKQKEGG